jgi:hypothetical protein
MIVKLSADASTPTAPATSTSPVTTTALGADGEGHAVKRLRRAVALAEFGDFDHDRQLYAAAGVSPVPK